MQRAGVRDRRIAGAQITRSARRRFGRNETRLGYGDELGPSQQARGGSRWPQGWRVLILRAYRNWDFPKGLLDPGESPLAAALRETREETGLANLLFNWGYGFTDTEPYAVGKVVRYFLAESPVGEVVLPVSAELGRPEHNEFRWVAPDDAAALLPARLVTVLRWAMEQLGAAG